MRARGLALAAFTLMLSGAASAATITADFDVTAAGVIGAPVDAFAGDTVVINLHVVPGPAAAGGDADSIAGWNFLFSYSDDLSLGSLVPAAGAQQSIDNPGRRFSYNAALSLDLVARGSTAVITMNIGPNGFFGDYLRLDGGSAVTVGTFDDVLVGPGGAGGVIVNVIPEPGTALLFGAGALGLALVRRRSA